MSWFLIIIISIPILALFWFIWMFCYWPMRNVRVLPSKVLTAITVKHATFARLASKSYEDMKKKGIKLYGIRNLVKPILIVTDLDVIGEILTDTPREHFWDIGYHFVDDLVLRTREPYKINLQRNWEDMCQKLIPDCSSRELKTVKESILITSDIMSEVFVSYAIEGKDIDVKEFLTCFTTDLIGLECYDIYCNSFKNIEGTLQWPAVGDFRRDSRFERIFNHPHLRLTLGIKATEVDQYLSTLIHDKIIGWFKCHEQCERYSYATNLWLYINEHHNPHGERRMYTMTWQHILFFNESFDLLASTLYFAIYELSLNPNIQEKARKEIQHVLERYNEIANESLNEMKYLQQIIYETLRMYPPPANFIRLCIANYKLQHADLTIKSGTEVLIPLFAIHRDPQYYPRPDVFDPERFNPENKEKNPWLYMPYGEGLRLCTSIHASLLQCKIGLIDILRKCEIRVSPKTKMPLQPDPEVFMKSIERLYIIAKRI